MTNFQTNSEAASFLRHLFDVAVEAAQPGPVISKMVDDGTLLLPKGRTIVVGAGKGSADMARALDRAWPNQLSGLVVVAKGQEGSSGRIRLATGSHPLPDKLGVQLANEMIKSVAALTADDLVIALMSGGASAMLPAPPVGMTLEDELQVNRALLHSGAPISQMNAIRKQFSTIKGGRLALSAAPAPVVTLVLSDIPGDDLALVGSGPTLPDTKTREDARELVCRWNISLPPAAEALLQSETNLPPEPDVSVFAANSSFMVASAGMSLKAAERVALEQGIEVQILSDAIEGEASSVGAEHAALVRRICQRSTPLKKPILLLSGGETTVTIRGACGRGGRNMEYLLALAHGIVGLERVSAIACDTDGIDGTELDAGAVAHGDSIERMRAAGVDPTAALEQHDAWTAFRAIGGLVTTGPTGTNVNDFRAILIGGTNG